MESKYYTPKIEEFCVNFEFEFLNKNNKWEKSNDFSLLFLADDTDTISEVVFYLEKNQIRVKHLDQEDIESLGFIKHKTIDNYWKLNECVLRLKNSKISVYIYDEYTIDRLIFEGSLKNKSELKKLMQQLNINSGKE